MSRTVRKWAWCLAAAFVCAAMSPARADQYPGVHAGEDSLVFVQASDDFGGLQGIVILSYEYSMDWVITSARLGVKTDSGLVLTDGNQYVYNADGTKRSEMQFSSLERAVDWEGMNFSVLPSYGYYLAPMVRGGLAYALVETRAGLPSQLVLAREAFDTGESINLFEGFLYQLSEGELVAQVAFTEVAFGTQGLVRGEFPEDFPPPPEVYPSMYPSYPSPSYPPPVPAGSSYEQPSGDQSGSINPSLPQGTEIPPEERIDRPRFTLEPTHDYDIPPVAKIGIVEFRSSAEIEGWGPTCDEYLLEALGGIEGVEPILIAYDSGRLGGAVMYDRAVWLCQEYGVDALMMSELEKLEVPGLLMVEAATEPARVNGRISSKLIDGVGGSTIWSGEFDTNRIHDIYELRNGLDPVIRNDLMYLVRSMVDDIVAKGALDGGHVD